MEQDVLTPGIVVENHSTEEYPEGCGEQDVSTPGIVVENHSTEEYPEGCDFTVTPSKETMVVDKQPEIQTDHEPTTILSSNDDVEQRPPHQGLLPWEDVEIQQSEISMKQNFFKDSTTPLGNNSPINSNHVVTDDLSIDNNDGKEHSSMSNIEDIASSGLPYLKENVLCKQTDELNTDDAYLKQLDHIVDEHNIEEDQSQCETEYEEDFVGKEEGLTKEIIPVTFVSDTMVEKFCVGKRHSSWRKKCYSLRHDFYSVYGDSSSTDDELSKLKKDREGRFEYRPLFEYVSVDEAEDTEGESDGDGDGDLSSRWREKKQKQSLKKRSQVKDENAQTVRHPSDTAIVDIDLCSKLLNNQKQPFAKQFLLSKSKKEKMNLNSLSHFLKNREEPEEKTKETRSLKEDKLLCNAIQETRIERRDPHNKEEKLDTVTKNVNKKKKNSGQQKEDKDKSKSWSDVLDNQPNQHFKIPKKKKLKDILIEDAFVKTLKGPSSSLKKVKKKKKNATKIHDETPSSCENTLENTSHSTSSTSVTPSTTLPLDTILGKVQPVTSPFDVHNSDDVFKRKGISKIALARNSDLPCAEHFEKNLIEQSLRNSKIGLKEIATPDSVSVDKHQTQIIDDSSTTSMNLTQRDKLSQNETQVENDDESLQPQQPLLQTISISTNDGTILETSPSNVLTNEIRPNSLALQSVFDNLQTATHCLTEPLSTSKESVTSKLKFSFAEFVAKKKKTSPSSKYSPSKGYKQASSKKISGDKAVEKQIGTKKPTIEYDDGLDLADFVDKELEKKIDEQRFCNIKRSTNTFDLHPKFPRPSNQSPSKFSSEKTAASQRQQVLSETILKLRRLRNQVSPSVSLPKEAEFLAPQDKTTTLKSLKINTTIDLTTTTSRPSFDLLSPTSSILSTASIDTEIETKATLKQKERDAPSRAYFKFPHRHSDGTYCEVVCSRVLAREKKRASCNQRTLSETPLPSQTPPRVIPWKLIPLTIPKKDELGDPRLTPKESSDPDALINRANEVATVAHRSAKQRELLLNSLDPRISNQHRVETNPENSQTIFHISTEQQEPIPDYPASPPLDKQLPNVDFPDQRSLNSSFSSNEIEVKPQHQQQQEKNEEQITSMELCESDTEQGFLGDRIPCGNEVLSPSTIALRQGFIIFDSLDKKKKKTRWDIPAGVESPVAEGLLETDANNNVDIRPASDVTNHIDTKAVEEYDGIPLAGHPARSTFSETMKNVDSPDLHYVSDMNTLTYPVTINEGVYSNNNNNNNTICCNITVKQQETTLDIASSHSIDGGLPYVDTKHTHLQIETDPSPSNDEDTQQTHGAVDISTEVESMGLTNNSSQRNYQYGLVANQLVQHDISTPNQYSYTNNSQQQVYPNSPQLDNISAYYYSWQSWYNTGFAQNIHSYYSSYTNPSTGTSSGLNPSLSIDTYPHNRLLNPKAFSDANTRNPISESIQSSSLNPSQTHASSKQMVEQPISTEENPCVTSDHHQIQNEEDDRLLQTASATLSQGNDNTVHETLRNLYSPTDPTSSSNNSTRSSPALENITSPATPLPTSPSIVDTGYKENSSTVAHQPLIGALLNDGGSPSTTESTTSNDAVSSLQDFYSPKSPTLSSDSPTSSPGPYSSLLRTQRAFNPLKVLSNMGNDEEPSSSVFPFPSLCDPSNDFNQQQRLFYARQDSNSSIVTSPLEFQAKQQPGDGEGSPSTPSMWTVFQKLFTPPSSRINSSMSSNSTRSNKSLRECSGERNNKCGGAKSHKLDVSPMQSLQDSPPQNLDGHDELPTPTTPPKSQWPACGSTSLASNPQILELLDRLILQCFESVLHEYFVEWPNAQEKVFLLEFSRGFVLGLLDKQSVTNESELMSIVDTGIRCALSTVQKRKQSQFVDEVGDINNNMTDHDFQTREKPSDPRRKRPTSLNLYDCGTHDPRLLKRRRVSVDNENTFSTYNEEGASAASCSERARREFGGDYDGIQSDSSLHRNDIKIHQRGASQSKPTFTYDEFYDISGGDIEEGEQHYAQLPKQTKRQLKRKRSKQNKKARYLLESPNRDSQTRTINIQVQLDDRRPLRSRKVANTKYTWCKEGLSEDPSYDEPRRYIPERSPIPQKVFPSKDLTCAKLSMADIEQLNRMRTTTPPNMNTPRGAPKVAVGNECAGDAGYDVTGERLRKIRNSIATSPPSLSSSSGRKFKSRRRVFFKKKGLVNEEDLRSRLEDVQAKRVAQKKRSTFM